MDEVQNETRPSRTPLLSVEDVTLRFGGVVALDGLGFSIQQGQICSLIGPNGAGKTSLFNCVSRLYHPEAGRILLDDKDLLSTRADKIISLGVARTFQNVAVFPALTVVENVMLGSHIRTKAGYWATALSLPKARSERTNERARCMEILDSFGLASIAHELPSGQPYGTLKRIEIARALASEPRLLLLDEPAGGLTHEAVAELSDVIRQVRDERGTTVLLVEHHMGMVMDVSDHVVVLEFGRKIGEGQPAQIQSDPRVLEAYLGVGS